MDIACKLLPYKEDNQYHLLCLDLPPLFPFEMEEDTNSEELFIRWDEGIFGNKFPKEDQTPTSPSSDNSLQDSTPSPPPSSPSEVQSILKRKRILTTKMMETVAKKKRGNSSGKRGRSGLKGLSVRSIPCFYSGCIYNYKRPGSSVMELSDRPLHLPAKYKHFKIRTCKKHQDKWKHIERSPGLCEICRGLNSRDGIASKYTNPESVSFILCLPCAWRQHDILGIEPPSNMEYINSPPPDSPSDISERPESEEKEADHSDQQRSQLQQMEEDESQSDESDTDHQSEETSDSGEIQESNDPTSEQSDVESTVPLDDGPSIQEPATAESYLEVFEKIEALNSELEKEEQEQCAFKWFLLQGYHALLGPKGKRKVTIPIQNRIPAKKIMSGRGYIQAKDPDKWGYVAQLEMLHLDRAREDCWVTFKTSKTWNEDAFQEALKEWQSKS